MKKRQWILGGVVLLALLLLLLWARNHIHFNLSVFRAQFSQADWRRIGIGFLCIFVGYFFRSARWAALMRHNKKVSALSLVGPQIMGFTAVALVGRVADLSRPYLVARKTRTEVSSQIAVYVVERLFDAGAMGLLFSLAILQLSQAQVVAGINHYAFLSKLSHNAPGVAAFLLRYGALVLTLLGALFLFGIRLGGEIIARVFEAGFGLVSKNLGRAAGQKIRTFHAGLDTIRSFADFAVITVLSVSMWLLIAAAYYQTMLAFAASPALSATTPSKAMFLMVISGGASIFQLPIVGWFSQIGLVAAALTGLYGATPEAATACAAAILLVTFLGIVPIGLVWSQFEHINLRRIAHESEHAGEELSPGT